MKYCGTKTCAVRVYECDESDQLVTLGLKPANHMLTQQLVSA